MLNPEEIEISAKTRIDLGYVTIKPTPERAVMQSIDMAIILGHKYYKKLFKQRYVSDEAGVEYSEICTDRPDMIVELGKLVTKALDKEHEAAHFIGE
jgi:hypothetical protein